MRTPRIMVATLAAIALLATAAGTSSARPRADEPSPDSVTVATGQLVDSSGQVVGAAFAIDDGTVAAWAVFAFGLAPGLHGLQLHSAGDCATGTEGSGASEMAERGASGERQRSPLRPRRRRVAGRRRVRRDHCGASRLARGLARYSSPAARDADRLRGWIIRRNHGFTPTPPARLRRSVSPTGELRRGEGAFRRGSPSTTDGDRRP